MKRKSFLWFLCERLIFKHFQGQLLISAEQKTTKSRNYDFKTRGDRHYFACEHYKYGSKMKTRRDIKSLKETQW